MSESQAFFDLLRAGDIIVQPRIDGSNLITQLERSGMLNSVSETNLLSLRLSIEAFTVDGVTLASSPVMLFMMLSMSAAENNSPDFGTTVTLGCSTTGSRGSTGCCAIGGLGSGGSCAAGGGAAGAAPPASSVSGPVSPVSAVSGAVSETVETVAGCTWSESLLGEGGAVSSRNL